MNVKSFLKTASLSELQQIQEAVAGEIKKRLAQPGNTTRVVTFTDGASRGNPGLAGAGILLFDPDGQQLLEDFRFLGECTNNEAEYRALLLALDHAIEFSADRVECFLDSELVVRQLNGQYALKSENLMRFYNQVQDRRLKFSSISFTHVPREHPNLQLADRLANKAIDEANKNKPKRDY